MDQQNQSLHFESSNLECETPVVVEVLDMDNIYQSPSDKKHTLIKYVLFADVHFLFKIFLLFLLKL